MSAPDTIAAETESFSFELDRLELVGKRLELRGRWFGVRGRRFVRPTITMRVGGAKHRALADLKHKPWAAEDGADWVASFSSAPQAADAEQIDLTVAPDITISLPVPVPRAQPTTTKPAVNGTGAAARATSGRRAKTDHAHRLLEQEQSRAREVRRSLEEAQAGLVLLTAQRDTLSAERDAQAARLDAQMAKLDALAARLGTVADERDALAVKLDALLTERDALSAELVALTATGGTGRAERDRLIAERDALQAERARLGKRVAALERELNAGADGVAVRVAELQGALEAERREAIRLRAQLSAVGPDPRATARGSTARPTHRTVTRRRRRTVWAIRLLTLIAMAAVIAVCVMVIKSPPLAI